MHSFKNYQVDQKARYLKTLELAFITSLILHTLFFLTKPTISPTQLHARVPAIEIAVEDIPATEHVKLPPAPARPSVPIPTESEEIPEDLTIESTELSLDLSKLPPPPLREKEDIEQRYVFVPYDEAPSPIGGFAAIQANLKYPSLARKAGLEARIVVGILIDESGAPVKAQVLRDSGISIGFEEAATAAVMSVKWKPALQRDQPVKVWVSIPISFRLNVAQPKVAT